MARAAAHGLTVSKPWGDYARHDFIVESHGAFQRVQVKSTTAFDGHAYLCNTVSRGPSAKVSRGYTRDQIDFFAFYIIAEDVWYIVPITAVARVRFAVFLNPHQRRNRYFPYLEAWQLLKSEPVAAAAAAH